MAAPRWPATQEEYRRLAQALAELVGGRTDVAARFYDFEEGGRRVKGWGPWKGRRVSKDYKPMPGETTWAGKDFKSGGAEYRILNPLSPANLVEHLRGKERLGVYVLDAQARCQFLAADFDDHAGQLAPEAVWAEVSRFVQTCTAHEWRVAIERSKSGSGYHVWLFFDTPVEAAKVRAIGKWLFEESQALRDGEDFSTFDRFFPSQSVIPPAGRGFGNLIGLPMCGPKDYAAGKTAWLDPAGQIIDDALGHTLALLEHGRNPAARIDAFMAEWKLTAETAEAYAGGARDPSTKLGTAEEFAAMRSRCKFVNWVPDRSAWPHQWPSATEPLWFAWLSNLSRFEDGEEWAQESNSWHPKYSAIDTTIKIEHSRCSSGPHTCAQIQKEGFKGCPVGGCKLPSGKPTKAPAGLAVWGQPRPTPTKRDRTVRITDPAAVTPPAEPDLRSYSGEDDDDARPWKKEIPIYPETGMPWPTPVGGMQVTTGGVQDHTNQYIVLRPLWVDALTRNYIGQWGISIRFFDFDWKLKTHAVPRERLHEQGGVLGRELAAYGLPIVPGKEKWVSRYLVLQEGQTARRIRAAGRLGWFDAPDSPAVFVLPDQVLGKSPEEIVYQPEVGMAAVETLHGRGSLRDWQKHVADPCVGNPMLMFSVMLAMAGPLLKLCRVENGGFHLYGVTTTGKTTAAQVAASVWGCGADPQQGPEVTSLFKWYTTGNALESVAEVRNDMLLTLDEISEVDPHELGRIIYQLAGGLSKGRANAAGGLRGMRTWRLLFFSTGEKSVRQMLSQVGQTQKGGQRVRLPDIPADNKDDGRRAVVQEAHGQDAKDFTQDLKAACARHYGLAGPVFATYLIAEAERDGMSTLSETLRAELRAIEERLTADVADRLPPEGQRVLRRFAIIALAGARAQLAGVLGWDLVQIMSAVREVRDRWLSDQGQEHSESDRGLAHLRNQLMRHGDRFRWLDGGAAARARPTRDLLGYRVKDYYLITEEGLRELCGEYDMRVVLHAIRNAGHLWHEADRLTRKSPKIEELGNSRPGVYWVEVAFMGEQQVYTEEDEAVSVETAPVRPAPLSGTDDIPF